MNQFSYSRCGAAHWRRRLTLFATLATAAGCSTAVQTGEEPSPETSAAPSSPTARQLVREMHDRYSGNWYSTLRFAQTNTFYTQAGKEETSRWVENLSVPGKLRIDFEPLASKSGLLILNNRVTTFDNGRKIDTRRSIQPILTLTADVYAIPSAVTIRRLDSLNIDLDKFRTAKLDNKPVYVVGANDGDLESNQIWIDADRLLLVRIIQQNKTGARTVVTDTRVADYRDIDGFPVAHRYMSSRDGKPYFREQYENVRVNARVPAGIFDASRWGSVDPDA